MIPLEQLLDGSASDRNFQKLVSLVIDTGGREIGLRWGTDTVTFTASKTSAPLVVAHGLGRTPVAVGAFTRDPIFGYAITARTATDFTVRGFVTDNVTTLTGSTTFDWIAIG